MRLRFLHQLTTVIKLTTLLAALLFLTAPGTLPAADRWERQASALLSKMTLDEKIGQMTQIDLGGLTNKSDLTRLFIGSMLSGGSSDPADNYPQTWKNSCDELQSYALKTRLHIPLLYGVDAVHGHNNIDGAVIFPHNIGLGATHNPDLVKKAAIVTAKEIAGTGIHWAFAPCVATAQDIRWGRTYESFSDSPELAGELGAEEVDGYQSKLPGGFRVLACSKHFAGDGGTEGGVDQGNVVCDEATFRRLFIAPYLPSLKEDVGSIMVSYNSWKGLKMHGNKYLLTDVLKKELGFKGFLISDYAAIDQLPGDYKSDIETSINAGLDMIMIPNGPGKENNYVEFITKLKQLVAEGKVPQARIDDAARRILRAKFQIGLFEHPYASPKLLKELGSAKHREVGRQCVRESLVLLKNESKALPLSRKLRQLGIAGKAANDLGMQCGGWTIDWQGKTGAVTHGGTTILEAIKKAAKDTQIRYSADGSNLKGVEAVVVVIGEPPYAEMKGDRQDLTIPAEDVAVISLARTAGVPVVTILLSGRPLVLGPTLDQSQAFIAAWLPGTEGDGVADVLFGAHKPSGKLPRHWPRDNTQLTSGKFSGEPQFPSGFGLTY
jgi:beta-glucosidase